MFGLYSGYHMWIKKNPKNEYYQLELKLTEGIRGRTRVKIEKLTKTYIIYKEYNFDIIKNTYVLNNLEIARNIISYKRGKWVDDFSSPIAPPKEV